MSKKMIVEQHQHLQELECSLQSCNRVAALPEGSPLSHRSNRASLAAVCVAVAGRCRGGCVFSGAMVK